MQDDSRVPDVEAAAKSPLVQAIGSTGLRNLGGFIHEEMLRDLQGRKGMAIFEEMASNDSTCGAILFAIKMLLRSMEWTIEPADADDERAVEAAETAREMLLYDMEQTWPDTIDSICSMFVYGYSVHEILWKKRNGYNAAKPWLSSQYDDGLWAPRSLAPRSQKTIWRWVFDAEEHLIGFEQQPWSGPSVVVPMSRCLHFRTTAELGNPEGRSVLRTAYRSWYWLKRLQEIEGVGTERDLCGYPVLRVPGAMLDVNAGPEAARARGAYEDFLRRVRRDQNEGVLLPSDRDENGNAFYEFSLLSSGGSRQIKTGESIDRYQRDIARTVLADFIFLGADGGGSLALGATKVGLFTEGLKAFSNHIAAQINECLIPQIWRLNGFDTDIMPTMRPGDMDKADLGVLGAFIQTLAAVGFDVSSDRNLLNYLRAKAELPPAPEPDDEDALPSGGVAVEGNEGGAGPEPDKADPAETEDDVVGKALRAAYAPAFDVSAILEGFDRGR